MANNNKPVKEIRLGAVKGAIWENQVGDTTRFNVVLKKIYKDGSEWKATDSFGRDELLLVAKVADQAHSWIFEQKTGNANVESRRSS